MDLFISVIICTHNPRLDYFEKVLKALEKQTLPFNNWELLIVDNASNQQLSSIIEIKWHPNLLYLREDKIGLTSARIRGIEEAKGDLFVFVDDDNVLGEDYLEEALHLLKKNPFIGAFSGSVFAETENRIEPWQEDFLPYLAVREVKQPIWGNISFDGQNIPYGAGLCIRRNVALSYSDAVHTKPGRIQLGRKGNLLTSAEDSDLALTAHDCGYATGVFPSLKLTHLIPSHRLEVEYILRLKREGGASGHILNYLRNGIIPLENKSLTSRIMDKLRMLKRTPLEKRMLKAEQDARQLALVEIRKLHKEDV